MRILTGIVPFLLTLFLGLLSVTLTNAFAREYMLPAEIQVVVANEEVEPTARPSGIRITYNGVFPRSKDHPPFLRFLIYNGSSDEVTCSGYSGRCAGPEVRVRELDATAWVCMNGSSRYTITPGESAELEVSAQDFNLLPGKTDNVVIGYTFYHPTDGPDQHFGEPIVVPAEFRKAVSKYLKEVRDLEVVIY